MSDSTAESLAGEILTGTYKPSTFDGCNGLLSLDRNPHVVRFVQFILFSNPNLNPRSPKEPDYMIWQQYERSRQHPEELPKAILENLVIPLAGALDRELSRGRLPLPDESLEPGYLPEEDPTRPTPAIPAGATQPSAELPSPDDARIDIDRIRVAALERRIPGYQPSLPEPELRQLYREWSDEQRAQSLQSVLEPVSMAGFAFDEELVSGARTRPDVLTGILTRVFLPGLYQPFRSPHPHVALCVTFEQVWEPKGYTRGELISSISLAPGEQMTLEVHSWDKSTIKREEELAVESELRVTENATRRDVLTVAGEVATQFGSHLNANATIPIKGIPVAFGAGTSSQINTKVNTTVEQTRERTTQASNTLKTTRKLRIETSREVGREQKQTRVIANTNRCHTLNCHYFEVMANYIVTTQFVSARPCLLLPHSRLAITPDWVLCYEDVLKQALLDKIFLGGFDAARVLDAEEELLRLRKEAAMAGGEIPGPPEALQAELDAVLKAWDRLRGAVGNVKHHAHSLECRAAAAAGGALGLAVCVALKAGVSRLRRVLYMAMLHTNERAVNALKKLNDAKGSMRPAEALRDFFAAVTPRDYRDTVTAAASHGLHALGLPGTLVDGLLAWQILHLVADDAGLYNAVRAAAERLEALLAQPATEGESKDGYSMLEVAQAQTAFDQLKCHIEHNLLHYLQAVWLREHGEARFLRLQAYGSVAAILDNEVLGFLGHKAGYPLTDLAPLKPQIDFEEILKALHIPASPPQLITMPTQGTILEAMVGECDACEEFIQQSRVFDLRTQEAKTREEEAEAKRREMRLDQAPPDLSDPKPGGPGSVVINMGGTSSGPSG